MTPRRVAIAAVALGLVLGSLGDMTRAAPPLRDGANWILAADFHVHGFFGDVGLAPWDLQAEARRRGLDVLAVTNHRGPFGSRFHRWWTSRTGGPLVLPAQELTTKAYHVLGIGLEETVEPTADLVATIRAVHARGGVAIAAHPNQEFWPAYTPDVLRAIDGIEVISEPDTGVPYARADITRFAARARAAHPGVAFIGGSDFHLVRPLGAARTFVVARAHSHEGVIEAIRSGRTVAGDIEGNLVGDRDLVAYVEGILARRPRDRGDGLVATVVCWMGAVLTWLGLATLVLLDRPSGRAEIEASPDAGDGA